MLTADYVETGADGDLVTKSEMLAGLRSGASKFEIFKVEDMKVHVHGDAAVVIGKGTVKGTLNGRPIDEQDQHDGRWMAAATQVTRIPKK
jgi:ketosteroid isomerase-like protein